MKRYGYLYEKVYDMDNIALAHKKAKRGKSNYGEVQMVDANSDKYFTEIHRMLKDKTFRNSKYEKMIRNEHGKVREIHKLPYYPDRIIHHCIMNIIEDIWVKSFIKDTWASIKNRGVHQGVKRIKKALEDEDNTKYCLKMDIKKFYPSCNNEITKQIIRKKIKDPDLLWLMDEIIDSANGLPIGNYLSQYLGNVYLSDYDHFVKKQQPYYFRYCDDMVILAKTKEELHKLYQESNVFLKEKLDLTIKDNWQIFPLDIRGLDFLGYRFFRKHTLIRKSIVNRFKKKLRQGITSEALASYGGWFLWGNTYNLTLKYT